MNFAQFACFWSFLVPRRLSGRFFIDKSTRAVSQAPFLFDKMTKANGDIQAIVLAGPGHRLFPLIDEAASSANASGSSLSAGQSPQAVGSTSVSGVSSGTLLSSTTSSPSKALLPLCNHPMIHYPLNWLMQAGVGGTEYGTFEYSLTHSLTKQRFLLSSTKSSMAGSRIGSSSSHSIPYTPQRPGLKWCQLPNMKDRCLRSCPCDIGLEAIFLLWGVI
jgi:hypothetical protein